MTYKLEFTKKSKKVFDKLNPVIKSQFKDKLKERIECPRVQSDKLFGMKDCYKIKLRSLGYRMVYHVSDKTVTVAVIAIGKRENNKVYISALSLINEK